MKYIGFKHQRENKQNSDNIQLMTVCDHDNDCSEGSDESSCRK
jgi:hypothetical protein